MPLQNRVTPFSKIVAHAARGAWTGNRGVIHNYQQEVIKNHAVKYWITCLLSYKGMKRRVMSPNRWTELFFLDEATAFAAGHRPCGFCRYAEFKKFKVLWLQANGAKYGLEGDIKMDKIDAIIHNERLDKNNVQKTGKAILQTLPDGVFIKLPENENAYLWYGKELFQWTFEGYLKWSLYDKKATVEVLTPLSYVEVFNAGYQPQIHESAYQ